MADTMDGYIIDFISGNQVKGTPEEIEAVQPFSKKLVEDYGALARAFLTGFSARRVLYLLWCFVDTRKTTKRRCTEVPARWQFIINRTVTMRLCH